MNDIDALGAQILHTRYLQFNCNNDGVTVSSIGLCIYAPWADVKLFKKNYGGLLYIDGATAIVMREDYVALKPLIDAYQKQAELAQ